MNNQVLVEHDYAAGRALLRNALAPSADVVAADPGTSGWDAEIVRSGSAPIRLRFRSGKTATGQGASPGDVWVLNRPLKGELQHLRERGQNFVALNGTVRIVEQWLLLERSGLAPRRSQQSGTSKRTDPFADRNSLIPRALLAHPERVWGVRELVNAQRRNRNEPHGHYGAEYPSDFVRSLTLYDEESEEDDHC